MILRYIIAFSAGMLAGIWSTLIGFKLSGLVNIPTPILLLPIISLLFIAGAIASLGVYTNYKYNSSHPNTRKLPSGADYADVSKDTKEKD